MIVGVLAAWSIASQGINAQWSVLLPDGVKVETARPYDFDRDGLSEVVVLGTITDAVSRSSEMDDSHTVVALLAFERNRWVLRSCKEVGQHFDRLQLADIDGDRVPEVLVFGRFWGADNITPRLHVYKASNSGLRFLDSFSGVNGTVEARDYSGSGRTEIKATNEYWDGPESHAEVHRSISIYFRWASGALRPFRALPYDRRVKTVQKLSVSQARRMLHWDRSGFEPEREPPGIDLRPKWITRGLSNCSEPAWSPDGKFIAFVVGLGQYDVQRKLEPTEIWATDAAGGSRRRITNFGDSLTDCPRWSPDGKFLAFRRMPEKDDDPAHGYWLCELETGKLRQVDDDIAVASWSTDSRSLVRDGSAVPIDGSAKRNLAKGEQIPTVEWDQHKRRNVEVWRYFRTIYLKRGSTVRQLVFKPGSNVEPALSPDGSLLAFSSFKLGTWGIWVADVKVLNP